MRLWINENMVETNEPPGLALLDFLRGPLHLLGTKAGCREGDCGACTVLVASRCDGEVAYEPVCACLTPLAAVEDRQVITVEGLNPGGLGRVQRAILAEGATQCGFCTPGIVLSLTGYLLGAPSPSTEGACAAVAGNLCRCTGYESIRRAAHALISGLPELGPVGETRLARLTTLNAVPAGLLEVAAALPEVLTGPGDIRSLSHALMVGGGTDLMVQRPAVVRDSALALTSRLVPRRIEARDASLTIGAAATVAELERSTLWRSRVPSFDTIAMLIASPQIRSRATVAGNLVNASPIGDLSILLLALGAELELTGAGQGRTLALDQFFLAYKQVDLRPKEVIWAITLPPVGPGHRVSFEKVSKRQHLDIASVNSACALVVEDGCIREARVSAGGVAPVPRLLEATSLALKGQRVDAVDRDAVASAAMAEVTPIDDVRGSAKYKRLLLGRIVLAHLERLLAAPAKRETTP